MRMMRGLFLPNHIICEILSWLPVKSLLRFKCVCKTWFNIIQDPEFITIHMVRAPCSWVYQSTYNENSCANFTFSTYWQGLVLERNNSTNAYRLRNPATRQILDLPCPPSHQNIIYINIFFIPKTSDLKLLNISCLQEEGDIHTKRYNILSINDLTWKYVDSTSCDPTKFQVRKLHAETKFYLFKLGLVGDSYFDCLDLENDRITRDIKIPRKLFLDWKNVHALNWKDGKLALACIDQKQQLNLWILEDDKKNKWAETKITISLTFLKDYPSMSSQNIIPWTVKENQIWWYHVTHDSQDIFVFDIESREVDFQTSPTTKKKILYIDKPSLTYIKGMHPETQKVKCSEK